MSPLSLVEDVDEVDEGMNDGGPLSLEVLVVADVSLNFGLDGIISSTRPLLDLRILLMAV